MDVECLPGRLVFPVQSLTTMTDSFSQQLDEVKAALRMLSRRKLTAMQQSEEALGLLFAADERFHDRVRSHGFATVAEEVAYFKCLRPALVSRIIYHMKVYHLLINEPPWSVKQLKKYYVRELDKIAAFYADNKGFIRYLRLGETAMDEVFFVRHRATFRQVSETCYSELDAEQSTPFSLKAARFHAYEQLTHFLQERLEALRYPKPAPVPVPEAPLPSSPAPDPEKPLRLLKSHQVERMLGISTSTLQKLRKTKEITCVRIGGTYYYDEAAIRRLLGG